MKKKHKDFREFKLQELKDVELSLAYLNEALNDKDQRIFLLALKDVIEAQGEDFIHIHHAYASAVFLGSVHI